MRPARRLALASLAVSTAALGLGFVRGKTEILILLLAILTALALISEARTSGWSPILWSWLKRDCARLPGPARCGCSFQSRVGRMSQLLRRAQGPTTQLRSWERGQADRNS